MHHAHRVVTGLLAILSFAAFSAAPNVNAATIQKVKGTGAIVAFDAADGTPEVGAKFFAMENGKKKAVIEIVQFKNGKAKVKIVKGKATEGMTLASAGAKKSTHAAKSGATAADDEAVVDQAEHSSSTRRARSVGGAAVFRDMTFGVIGGYAMDSQTVSPSGGVTQTMTGTGMSAKGFVDIPVTSTLGLLARVGADQFNVSSSSSKTEILYATVDLMLKYAFSEGTFIPFAIGGLGLHFPLSKTSNVLNVNQISSTTVFYGGAGINWLLGGSTYLHLTAEYGMFPPSNEVSTSFIAGRMGLGFRF